MSRISRNCIAVLFAVGTLVLMHSLAPKPGLAETLGNGDAKGFAAIGISDSDAGAAIAIAIGGIAIGPDSNAFTKDATHPCAGGSDATDCGQGNIAIGTSSGASNDFAVAVGFLSKASALNGSAYGPNTKRAASSVRPWVAIQERLRTAQSPPAMPRPPMDPFLSR
jgi:hypothetical protein